VLGRKQYALLSFGQQLVEMQNYSPESGSGGPSWLTFPGHMKDSLWSCDLFRCESATLRAYRVLIVMDQFTGRIVGFGVWSGIVDGAALCEMFNRAIRGQTAPIYLSTIHLWSGSSGPYAENAWNVVLDHDRPGGEATRFPTLL
jgi:hypothetical protein